MEIKAFAKLNLRLKCVGKNNNNYHLLNMVNAKISLYDVIDITESNVNSVTFDVDSLNHLENNICLNILNDMCNIYNIKKRYHIYIKKNIPQGAGLGGGSCDAAAIINFLNEDNHLNISIKELESFGLKYGADIPYCLHDDLCFVEGVGEIVTPLNQKINRGITVIYPNIFLSTKEVFANNHIYSNKDDIKVIKNNLNNLDYILDNDLEESAFNLNNELKLLKEELSQYGPTLMSGSGSTLVVYKEIDINKLKLSTSNLNIFSCKIL